MPAEEATEAILEKQEKGYWVGWLNNQLCGFFFPFFFFKNCIFLKKTRLWIQFGSQSKHTACQLQKSLFWSWKSKPYCLQHMKTLCVSFWKRLRAIARCACTPCSKDNGEVPIEMFSMSLRYFHPLKQASDHSCQYCSPSFKFQNVPETQDMEIST